MLTVLYICLPAVHMPAFTTSWVVESGVSYLGLCLRCTGSIMYMFRLPAK